MPHGSRRRAASDHGRLDQSDPQLGMRELSRAGSSHNTGTSNDDIVGRGVHAGIPQPNGPLPSTRPSRILSSASTQDCLALVAASYGEVLTARPREESAGA